MSVNGPIVSRVVRAGDGGTGMVEVELDPVRQAFLYDHRVGGTPLLSTVMGIEAMARSACLLNPGLVVTEVRDVEVSHPCRVHGSETGRVSVAVGRAEEGRARRSVVVSSESAGGEPVLHFRATLELAVERPDPPGSRQRPRRPAAGVTVDATTVYSLYFHGPSFRVLGAAHSSESRMVGHLAPGLPPISRPPGPTAMAPLLIELGLQTAGLLELVASARMMIPSHIDRIVRYRSTESYDGIPLRADVGPCPDVGGDAAYRAAIVDDDGVVHLSIDGYRTTELAQPPEADAIGAVVSAFRR